MNDLPSEVQALLGTMIKQPGINQDQVSRVEAALADSPFLANVAAIAARNGSLKGIALSDRPNEAGHYAQSTGFIHLHPMTISGSDRTSASQQDYLTVTLGHETSHALRAAVSRQELDRFSQTVELKLQEAVNSESYVDLTAAAGRYLDEGRHNESLAELVGLNALADSVRHGNGGRFDPAEFTQRASAVTSCVVVKNDVPSMAAGIEWDRFGFQDAKSPRAIEAMASCFYDRPEGLGRHGDLGYRNYYGGSVIETIAGHWQDTDRYARITGKAAPDVRLNLAELGLDARRIERNGLDLEGQSFGFIDTSHGQLQLATVRPGRPAANDPQPRTDEPMADPPGRSALRADRAEHPDHAAFALMRSVVRADGRWDDVQADNIAASLLSRHKADPLSQRLDAAYVGKPTAQGDTHVFAVYAPFGLGREPQFLASVEAGRAAAEPAAQSLDRVDQLNQQRAQTSLSPQWEAPAPEIAPPIRRLP